MSWIAGIDYSTHAIDVVLIDEDGSSEPVWHRWKLEGQDAFERVRYVDHAVADTSTWGDIWDDVLAVGIEDPRGQNAGAMYRVQGAILACLPRKLLVQPWIPSQWRKAVGVAGNASKQTVASIIPLYSWNVGWPQDACDAYCIALATRQAIERQAAA